MILPVLPVTTINTAQAEQESNLSEQSTIVRLREEPLQWTPQTVTVIDKADLESTHQRDLEDLQGIAPGVIIDSMSGTPAGTAISIRGLGSSETSKGFEPAVAVIVDGVYLGTHASQMQVLFDFEQAEIARGPQTTYRVRLISAALSAFNELNRPVSMKAAITHLEWSLSRKTTY